MMHKFVKNNAENKMSPKPYFKSHDQDKEQKFYLWWMTCFQYIKWRLRELRFPNRWLAIGYS